MADVAPGWAILEATKVRLQQILVANGYHTDAGADVRLEPQQFVAGDAPRIHLYAGNTVRPEDARARGERAFDVIAEAYVSTAADDAQAMVVAIADDIELALDAYLPQPAALPLVFEECVFLDKPDGVAAMVAQVMFSTRYRRDRA